MKNKKLDFNLAVLITKEGENYIAYSPALDLSTSGKSYEEAKKRFAEIANIFLEEVIQEGTLETVLSNLGWQNIRKKWNPPVVVSSESQKIEVMV